MASRSAKADGQFPRSFRTPMRDEKRKIERQMGLSPAGEMYCMTQFRESRQIVLIHLREIKPRRTRTRHYSLLTRYLISTLIFLSVSGF